MAFSRAIDASLRRLDTDYIDLYQTHWPDHDFPYEHTLSALHECVREGKARYLGSSNENAWGVMKALAIAERNGCTGPTPTSDSTATTPTS